MARTLSVRFLVPNSVTAASIVLGFCSMLAATREHYDLAVHLLVGAILLDALDGRLARWLKATSRFGQEMDSFSDALSFGAAPAFLIFEAVLHPLGPSGAAVSLIFLLAAVLRLARFNLTSDHRAKERRTVGVPTPVGAGYVMALVLMREQLPVVVAVVLVLALAVGMVSKLRLPEMQGRSLVTLMLVVGIGNYLAVVARPNWYTVGWWNLWNVLIFIAARAEDRRLQILSSG
jgi:CDP-diacylglycerol--serine O-phosphatidyltransferase